jgi:hypothetical protein
MTAQPDLAVAKPGAGGLAPTVETVSVVPDVPPNH